METNLLNIIFVCDQIKLWLFNPFIVWRIRVQWKLRDREHTGNNKNLLLSYCPTTNSHNRMIKKKDFL